MNEKILQIVSNYTKIPVDNINDQTVIDKNALVNSILVHRMYAAIAKEGKVINDYYKIHTFKDLKNIISVNNNISENYGTDISFMQNSEAGDYADFNSNSIGVDIESVSNIPKTDDFRTDEFYKYNFTSQETSYCILQPNSYASFAGLFAAKEAIVKAENKYRDVPFHKIEITHNQDGRPVIAGFNITISHTNDLAIAVAIKENIGWKNTNDEAPANLNSSKNTYVSMLLLIAAIVLSLVAIIISIFK